MLARSAPMTPIQRIATIKYPNTKKMRSMDASTHTHRHTTHWSTDRIVIRLWMRDINYVRRAKRKRKAIQIGFELRSTVYDAD